MTFISKKIIILAGPNGAGKTAFARSFLPDNCPRFINADLIASGLAPFAPETAAIKAARLMRQEMTSCVDHGENFAFETTLSGLTYRQHIKVWQQKGYHITLFFLALPSVDLAIERVAQRVRQGGHNIPEAIIRRRFKAGMENFEQHYQQLVDSWALYDNSGNKPTAIKWGENE